LPLSVPTIPFALVLESFHESPLTGSLVGGPQVHLVERLAGAMQEPHRVEPFAVATGLVDLYGPLPALRVLVSEASPFRVALERTENAGGSRDDVWHSILEVCGTVSAGHLEIPQRTMN
jgi:hypothetical protein